MRARATEAARALDGRRPAGRFEAVDARAEALPFESGSVDTLISTLLLCSVPDAPACVREFARVLRPGGRWIFIEHVAADAERDGALLPAMQAALNPLQRALVGCNLRGDPGRAILGSGDALGFSGVAMDRFDLQDVPDSPLGGELAAVLGGRAGFAYERRAAAVDPALRFNPLLPSFILSSHLSGVLVR